MPSAFDDLNGELNAAVDAVFAEGFVLRPRAVTKPNGRSEPDPSRAVVDFLGITAEVASRANSGQRIAHMAPRSDRAGFASSRINVGVSPGQLPYRPRTGDYVLRVDTNELFEIAEIRPDGMGGYALDLNELVAPP
ncbi:hypothetical protein IMF23_04325 [Chelatococcus daeguensis]|uniref:Uncharacterized protein n=1 Tax=Chelatococcus sambhunathii TaxID=363953 RepID=A0ABM9U9I1_9HYPH|nr:MULTISPECIES: hypothetical protein [Chelatococcus]KZE34105.1 hypothetical protein AVW15_17475 [Chelatococcus daeguensis]MBM3082662.1 hypothetical protein [Chelatococcus daeguensis]CUA90911.1 hypothetical protein Ga0061061_11648 [Chelatococcus sambhunathii]